MSPPVGAGGQAARIIGAVPIDQFAPTLHGPTLSAQNWDNLSFLHWPIDPAAVARFFPNGVRPDVIEGRTYVGLVPFEMRGAGPGRASTPYFGSFCETNVRLYSVDDQDRHGIVFLTLDATRLATVLLARLSLGLPYAWAAMSARREADVLTYRSIRRWPQRRRRAGGTIRVRIGDAVDPTPTEIWLTSRWGLHTEVAGRTIWVPNQHGPWPLFTAELLDFDCDLVEACGLTVAAADRLRPLWSPGVHTTFGLPARVDRRAASRSSARLDCLPSERNSARPMGT